jgi:uncharacterized protein
VYKLPGSLFARETEWKELVDFATGTGSENRLAIMLGRRRQGKSMLVRHLAEVSGGFYFEAAQQSSGQNLAEFSRLWSEYSGSTGISFDSWASVVAHLGSLPSTDAPRVVVFDEVGYLISSAPELPSLLQRLFTERSAGGLRIVLCGSAFAQMRKLLDPSAPLRGRQHRTIQVNPFDYRTAARFWGVYGNPDAAFRLHALIGGTPAYRRFTIDGPLLRGDVHGFMVNHVMSPSSVLYAEGRSIVSEDDSLEDKSLYWAVLNAVADGATRRGEIARALGRPDSALHVPIEALVAASLLEKRPDPLNRRATTMVATEPMLRTERVLLAPERARIERGRSQAVWEDAQPRLARQIYAPHLEWMAAEWMLTYASRKTAGGDLRSAAPAMLTQARQRSQLDVVGVAPDRNDVERVCAIGECKAGAEAVGLMELQRLDAVIRRLGGKVSENPKRLLFARAGFTAELKREARVREDVELVDLKRLYHGD